MFRQFRVYAVLPTSDLPVARQWYEDKLAMVPSKEDPGGLWYECADGTWFVLTPSAFAGTAQNTAMSFEVDDLEGLMVTLRANGVVFEDYDLPEFKTTDGLFTMGPYKAAWFKDADDNIVELSEVPS